MMKHLNSPELKHILHHHNFGKTVHFDITFIDKNCNLRVNGAKMNGLVVREDATIKVNAKCGDLEV